MKRCLFVLALIALVALAVPPDVTFAQDILDVAALPPGNLNTVINGDTLEGGVRAHPDRIYRLNRGSVYQMTEALKINGDLHMIATDGTNRPPVLAPAILVDNGSIDHFFDFIGKGGNVTLTNLYVIGQRADNAALGWGECIRVGADSVKLKLRGMIFDGFQHSTILPSYWTKLDIQDCNFRNNNHPTSWFGGDAILSGNVVALDTVKIINNTFLVVGATTFNVRGYTPYAAFEHNTVVYNDVYPNLTRNANFMRIRNNIYYQAHAMGGTPDHTINGWFLNYPDTASTSIIQIRAQDSVSYWSKLWATTFTGPEIYADESHGVTPEMVSATQRVVDIQNNNYFWAAKYLDFIQTYNDTVATWDSVDVPVYGQTTPTKMYLKRILNKPTWITACSQWQIDSLIKPLSPYVTIANNTNEDPGLGATVAAHVDKQILYIHKICTNALDTTFKFPSNNTYPPAWPLPEGTDLAYTNAALQHAGTDGFALGDLNHFPEQKAQWLLTDVQRVSELPEGYSLSQNYPNPFNPTTQIEFSIPKQSNVELKVFNMLGQEVATLASATMPAGRYTVDFNGAKLASGMYIYRLKADNFVTTAKMVLMK